MEPFDINLLCLEHIAQRPKEKQIELLELGGKKLSKSTKISISFAVGSTVEVSCRFQKEVQCMKSQLKIGVS